MKQVLNAAVLLVACAVVPAAVAGPLTIEGKVESSTGGFPSYYQQQEITASKDQPSLSLNHASPSGSTTGALSAYVAPGVVKIATQAASGSIGDGSASAFAKATWSTELTFSNEALNGSQGRVTFNHYYDYKLDLLIFGDANVGSGGTFLSEFDVMSPYGVFQTVYYTNADIAPYGTRNEQHQITYGEEEDVTLRHQKLSFDFIWGRPITVWSIVWAGCGVSEGGPPEGNTYASCSLDASHSSYWDGFSDLSANGVAVTDYRLTSDVGQDFSHSFVPDASPGGEVPEPGSAALVLAGLVLAVHRARRRS